MSNFNSDPKYHKFRQWKTESVLTEEDRNHYVRLIELGFSLLEACRIVRRNYQSVLQTRHLVPEFEEAIQAAKTNQKNAVVEDAMVRKAVGYITTIETYVPLLDDKKQPVIGKDGNCVMRLSKKTVREAAPCLAAQKVWLAANKKNGYAFLQNNAEQNETNISINVDPDELKKKLAERIEELGKTDTTDSPKV